MREEREVQKLEYDRYEEIYGKRSPFKYMSDKDFEGRVKRYDRLNKQLIDLVNENNPRNNTRIEWLKEQIREEAARLNQGVKNDDYNWKEDKISGCSGT